MKNNPVMYILPIIFSVVGLGMLIGGYTADPGSLTDDGYPLNYFLYAMGSFFIIFPIALVAFMTYSSRRHSQNVIDLKAKGLKGKARVLSVQRTGLSINDIPQVILQLHITTDLGEQFTVDYKKCIDPFFYNLITPERDLLVYINRDNKKEVYLDLEAEWSKLAEE
ncbi:hypothetical protein MUU74_14905 [Chryseobacterium daecheongense]|uniref:hypothetical protein n=1 Tax=Chryseobacterium daecheongense TaxID=192389 RepID=UPI001FD6A83E|nr:hypothetical protein [Chryseobacterium daecheongense]UOU97776.1 hypothetical protein MUU74_14905 [Chryseobacterium daecheongense]